MAVANRRSTAERGLQTQGSRLAAVERYIAATPPELQEMLRTLRRAVRSAAPAAAEGISYRMPAFWCDGPLVCYAAFRRHCSFFLGSVRVRTRFRRELSPYSGGKGTVRFFPGTPIPVSLVRQIVRERVRENRTRAELRMRSALLARTRTKRTTKPGPTRKALRATRSGGRPRGRSISLPGVRRSRTPAE